MNLSDDPCCGGLCHFCEGSFPEEIPVTIAGVQEGTGYDCVDYYGNPYCDSWNNQWLLTEYYFEPLTCGWETGPPCGYLHLDINSNPDGTINVVVGATRFDYPPNEAAFRKTIVAKEIDCLKIGSIPLYTADNSSCDWSNATCHIP